MRLPTEKVSVSSRTLGIQAEIFHGAILQHNDLDVLAAHVNDGIHVGLEL